VDLVTRRVLFQAMYIDIAIESLAYQEGSFGNNNHAIIKSFELCLLADKHAISKIDLHPIFPTLF
jgi:hypothetical protein